MKHVLRRLRSNMWKRIIKIYKSNNKCASICGIKFCKIEPLLLTLANDNLSYPQGEFLAVHIVAQIHQTRKLEYLCISSILCSFIHLWRVFLFFLDQTYYRIITQGYYFQLFCLYLNIYLLRQIGLKLVQS